MGAKCVRALETVCKQSGETVKAHFRFAAALASGETISTVGTPTVSPSLGSFSAGSEAISGTDIQVLLSSGQAPISVSAVSAANDTLTATTHGLATGDRVHACGDDLPGGLDEQTQYYVVKVDANTVKLSTVEGGGDAVGLSDAGSGDIKLGVDYLVTVQITTSESQTINGEGICQLRE